MWWIWWPFRTKCWWFFREGFISDFISKFTQHFFYKFVFFDLSLSIFVDLIKIRWQRAFIFVSISEIKLKKPVSVYLVEGFTKPDFSDKAHLIMIILTLTFCPCFVFHAFSFSFFPIETFLLFSQIQRVFFMCLKYFFSSSCWIIFRFCLI